MIWFSLKSIARDLNGVPVLLNSVPEKAASYDRQAGLTNTVYAESTGGFMTGDLRPLGRAGSAAGRLEQAWQRWRVVHGFTGAVDPPTSYVGRSFTEPMGQPRVVMGIDAAEAIRFADFLDRRAGLCIPRPEPALSSDQLAASPQTAVAGAHSAEAEYPVLFAAARTTATRVFEQMPAPGTWSRHASDPVGDEIARWDISNQ